MGGIGVGLAVAIGDGLTADSISSIRPAGKVVVAAALAAERPPARINRTDLTQDAQLGLAHPNNHNSQRPIPNAQPLPNSDAQLPKPSILLGVLERYWELGIGRWAWSGMEVGRWELTSVNLQQAPEDGAEHPGRRP
jgi:hypothetical protein